MMTDSYLIPLMLILSVLYVICWMSDNLKVKCMSVFFAGAPFTIPLLLILNFTDESLSSSIVQYYTYKFSTCDVNLVQHFISEYLGRCEVNQYSMLINFYYYTSITVFVVRLSIELIVESVKETVDESKAKNDFLKELERENIRLFED